MGTTKVLKIGPTGTQKEVEVTTTEDDPLSLHLDQSSPQTVTGIPNFSDGINLNSGEDAADILFDDVSSPVRFSFGSAISAPLGYFNTAGNYFATIGSEAATYAGRFENTLGYWVQLADSSAALSVNGNSYFPTGYIVVQNNGHMGLGSIEAAQAGYTAGAYFYSNGADVYLATLSYAIQTAFTVNLNLIDNNAQELVFDLGNRVAYAAGQTEVMDWSTGALQINNAYTLPAIDGGAGYYLATDGFGAVTWTAPAGMVYPAAGIAVSTGSAWAASITDNSANWDAAYGWGNHASAGYLTSSSISDTAYGSGWNGDTTVAPSKNAVYDKINSLATKTLQVTADLTALYATGITRWKLIDMDRGSAVFPSGITITSIYVDCSANDPTTELNGNIKYCDALAGGAFPGANVTLVNAIDTTTGNFSITDMSTSSLGSGVIPAGKILYFDLDADPVDTSQTWSITINYTVT